MARKLARSVTVDGQTYPAGSTPPAKVAKKIRTRSAWAPGEATTSDETSQDPGDDQDPGDGGNENTDQTPPQGGDNGTDDPGDDQDPGDGGNENTDQTPPQGGDNGTDDPGDDQDPGDGGEEDAEASDSDPLEEPPRRGRGATDAAWRKHAQALGVDVADDAGRDDVQAMLIERGLIDPS